MTVKEYNACVDQHADAVYRFIVKNLRDEEKSRDVVQEAFTRMWEKAGDIDGRKAKSYLFTSAYHIMIDTIRKDGRQTGMEEVHENHHYTTRHYSDLKQVLNDALLRLPEVQRSVIMLRDYEGYSYDEIGQICGLNESQVKVYIYRGRVALKKYIVSMENLV
ncbi:MAG: RNA polymerase sigma factor [Bacteroidales bacterium]|jgi:RNA polymerase sigma-70 factor (ECF subfamily)|nr:RNA polymerase sigma factor [Bacteroidales bacterium]MDD3664379.1 RNA polymerase sigma factor [Bacteroidales bacterium]